MKLYPVNEYTKFDELVKTDLIKREVDDKASERNEQKRLCSRLQTVCVCATQ